MRGHHEGSNLYKDAMSEEEEEGWGSHLLGHYNKNRSLLLLPAMPPERASKAAARRYSFPSPPPPWAHEATVCPCSPLPTPCFSFPMPRLLVAKPLHLQHATATPSMYRHMMPTSNEQAANMSRAHIMHKGLHGPLVHVASYVAFMCMKNHSKTAKGLKCPILIVGGVIYYVLQ